MRAWRVTGFCLWVFLLASCAVAQSSGGKQSYFGAIFHDEANNISHDCSRKDFTGTKPLSKYVPGCLTALFRGNKGLYAAFSNLPPGNGFALGAVFKDSELNTKGWRMNYQIDAQRSFNASWTAGGMLTMRKSPTFSNDKKPAKPPSVVVKPLADNAVTAPKARGPPAGLLPVLGRGALLPLGRGRFEPDGRGVFEPEGRALPLPKLQPFEPAAVIVTAVALTGWPWPLEVPFTVTHAPVVTSASAPATELVIFVEPS